MEAGSIAGVKQVLKLRREENKGAGSRFSPKNDSRRLFPLDAFPLSEQSFTDSCLRAPPQGGCEVTAWTSLRLAGWKSIRDAEIKLRPLNVFIGENGAGKSNLVGFFKTINEMRKGRFQVYVGTAGGAEVLLHYGSKQTAAIEAEFRFATDLGPSAYSFRLVPAAANSLIFDEEKLTSYLNVSMASESFTSKSAQ